MTQLQPTLKPVPEAPELFMSPTYEMQQARFINGGDVIVEQHENETRKHISIRKPAITEMQHGRALVLPAETKCRVQLLPRSDQE